MAQEAVSVAQATPEQATSTAPKGAQEQAKQPAEGADIPEWKKIKHRVKVNGKEAEVDYDELIKRYQQEAAADEKFKSAAQLREEAAARAKEAEEFEKDPWGHYKKKGKDPYQIAEDLLLQKIKWEQMSQEQKELAEERAKRLELEKRLEDMTAAERAQLQQQADAKAAQEIDDEISAAIQEQGLKPTPAVIAQIAANMLVHLEGNKKVPAKDVVRRTHESIQSAAKELITGMSVEELQAFLPKEALDGLRKAGVAKALAQDPMRSRKEQSATSTTERSGVQTIRRNVSTDEAFAALDKRFARKG